jgi:hypothetical protein
MSLGKVHEQIVAGNEHLKTSQKYAGELVMGLLTIETRLNTALEGIQTAVRELHEVRTGLEKAAEVSGEAKITMRASVSLFFQALPVEAQSSTIGDMIISMEQQAKGFESLEVNSNPRIESIDVLMGRLNYVADVLKDPIAEYTKSTRNAIAGNLDRSVASYSTIIEGWLNSNSFDS